LDLYYRYRDRHTNGFLDVKYRYGLAVDYPGRENEYRHPPCTLYSILDYSALALRSRREQLRELVENPPCTDIELIVKFNSISWL
jgi:hypothetical protein